MSGVEEGGGEPSSGNTPDKKASSALHRPEALSDERRRSLLADTVRGTSPLTSAKTLADKNFAVLLIKR